MLDLYAHIRISLSTRAGREAWRIPARPELAIRQMIFAKPVRFVLIYGLVTGGGGMMLGQQRQEVERVVKWQLENYPESRLTDLYKNFFQDKFGPGHMVADTASAGAYIRRESLIFTNHKHTSPALNTLFSAYKT